MSQTAPKATLSLLAGSWYFSNSLWHPQSLSHMTAQCSQPTELFTSCSPAVLTSEALPQSRWKEAHGTNTDSTNRLLPFAESLLTNEHGRWLGGWRHIWSKWFFLGGKRTITSPRSAWNTPGRCFHFWCEKSCSKIGRISHGCVSKAFWWDFLKTLMFFQVLNTLKSLRSAWISLKWWSDDALWWWSINRMSKIYVWEWKEKSLSSFHTVFFEGPKMQTQWNDHPMTTDTDSPALIYVDVQHSGINRLHWLMNWNEHISGRWQHDF